MREATEQKNEYAKAISLFLAELLRTRKITLHRAADIAQKVVENINLIDTEEHFLKLVKELSSDFDELQHLVERYHMHLKVTDRKDLEHKARMFAIQIMSSDMNLALQVLQEATKENAQLEDLYIKIPQLKHFVESNPHP